MIEAPSATAAGNHRHGSDWFIPPEKTGLISPPVSRIPSSLSISSLSSEKNYGHLRPLPSPCPDGKKDKDSRSSLEDDRSSLIGSTGASPGSNGPAGLEASPESPSSTSSKTNAFFSSPFSIAIPRSFHDPQPHPPPRTSSLAIPRRKQPHDTLASELDNSPSIFNTNKQISSSPKSRIVSDPSTSSKTTPSRAQTANSSFFFAPSIASSSSMPVPPPPLPTTLAASPDKPKGSIMSRFFASRQSAKPADVSVNPEPMVPGGGYISQARRSIEGLPRSPSPLHRTFHQGYPSEEPSAHPGQSAAPPHSEAENAGVDVLRLEVPSPQKPQPKSSPVKPPIPIRRETQNKNQPSPIPHAGDVIGAPETPLQLIEQLGRGAFSSVWLAKDQTGELGLRRKKSIGRVGSMKKRNGRRALSSTRDRDNRLAAPLEKQGSAGDTVSRGRRESQSIAMKERDSKLGGLMPVTVEEGITGSGLNSPTEASTNRAVGNQHLSVRSTDRRPPPPRSNSTSSSRRGDPGGRLVAVKMLDRALCDANDRTRISFVREVEVLRHISHASIVSYLHSLTTPTHHCLILEHVAGGELFDLINTDERHARMTEPLLRRMWSELCRAVAWMHSVYLVHRDIKLENILLTCNPFEPQYAHPSSPNTPALDLLPSPLLKLTDFGLSRFIDPANPLLATRCGSESYAAPEIVMGTKYDGRQTDAWACGVVLFALATRRLPFDRSGTAGRLTGGEGSGMSDYGPGGGPTTNGSVSSAREEVSDKVRRSYLIRIAKNEWSWPAVDTPAKLVTTELKSVVERLLVRDAQRRAKMIDLWDEEWMNGAGSLPKPGEGFKVNIEEDELPRRISTSREREAHAVSFLDEVQQERHLEPDVESVHNEHSDIPEVSGDELPSANEDDDADEEHSEGVFVNADKIDSVALLDLNPY